MFLMAVLGFSMLASDGIKITPLGSSNTFFDMAGDGYQALPEASKQRAWAGAGNGPAGGLLPQRDFREVASGRVLVLDLAGNGQITQRNQIVFTDWDPTAKALPEASEEKDLPKASNKTLMQAPARGLARRQVQARKLSQVRRKSRRGKFISRSHLRASPPF